MLHRLAPAILFNLTNPESTTNPPYSLWCNLKEPSHSVPFHYLTPRTSSRQISGYPARYFSPTMIHFLSPISVFSCRFFVQQRLQCLPANSISLALCKRFTCDWPRLFVIFLDYEYCFALGPLIPPKHF